MIIKRLLEFLAPGHCVNCGREGAVLCGRCLPIIGAEEVQAVCFRCSFPSPAGQTCGPCRRKTRLAGVIVAAYYGGGVKELILQLKFHRLGAAAEAAAQLVLQALPEDLSPEVVTAVPISAVRRRERGYNQAELVARRVAARLNVPYSPLLGRVNAVHQMGLSREERLAQIKGAFYAIRHLYGRRVLMVDDVITTGATLSECAEVLAGAGAGGVWGAVVARH